ncbi:HAD hydrolase-like protein [Dietzia aerolata]|uniref:HAD hydrolase-like protein n=1 Tax=Dietzia aerolata TaxID=595984 RepID=A0ABV5JPT3_9ACTN|nr:HAD hydrolase-like protein [Dietzia aerolata]MBB0969103.1 HAD hydrolase-like protein [Dietzia aerolata]
MTRRGSVLVLWDLDLTLLDPAGFGSRMITPVLAELIGREPVMGASFAGRTDRAILSELLVLNGLEVDHADGDGGGGDELVLATMDAVAERCERFADSLLASGGGPLPGAHDAVRALAADPQLHQGIVTGNLRRTALLKLRICGFDSLPDPALGAFGDHHIDRAHLVHEAMAAARGQGLDVSPAQAVVVGDHVHDVRGALDAGARCVGVATGRVSADELHSAGAHVVLPDLTDADALRTAIHASIHAGPSRPA